MNPPVTAPQLNQPFTGWEELKQAAPAWRIERPQTSFENYVPFFPDQNGRVYELMLQNLPVMMHCMDGGGRLTSVNKRWSEVLGYTTEELQGRVFNDLLVPDSRARLVQEVYPHYLKTGVCRDEIVTLFRRGGAAIQLVLSMNAYRGDKGRIERSICVLNEPVSINVAAPVTLVDDQRFRGAFESAPHGMALVSPLGEIALANSAFWDFLGKPLEAREGVTLEGVMQADDRALFLAEMGELIKGNAHAIRQDIRFCGDDGRMREGSTSVALVRNSEGQIEQLIVQVADISERKQAAQRLQHAQKMEAIGQMTGGLAHDFNNLLTVIIGNLQLLEGKLTEDDRGARRLAEAIDAAKRGSGLTHQMLAFARKQVLEPREVMVNDMVKGIAPLISRSIGETIQFKVDTMAGEPKALIDPSQLESAVLNLAINARDAMGKSGLLTLETQAVYLDQAYAAKYPEVIPGHYVMVAVSDTGSGIPPELIEKVFQPFFTTKAQGKGSGLGLAMVYGFIKQSGGHISIYSEVGHGTAIKMYLPRKFAVGEEVPEVEAALESAVEIAEPVAAEAAPQRKPRILVVEDQEAVRAVACGFLEDFGYDIVEAEDGLQALARLQENSDIDLMFSDVVMPGGLNGFDLAQAARGIRPDLKVVHTSGYPKGAMVHQEEPRFREGFIIMKPYRREELKKIISDALEYQE